MSSSRLFRGNSWIENALIDRATKTGVIETVGQSPANWRNTLESLSFKHYLQQKADTLPHQCGTTPPWEAPEIQQHHDATNIDIQSFNVYQKLWGTDGNMRGWSFAPQVIVQTYDHNVRTDTGHPVFDCWTLGARLGWLSKKEAWKKTLTHLTGTSWFVSNDYDHTVLEQS